MIPKMLTPAEREAIHKPIVHVTIHRVCKKCQNEFTIKVKAKDYRKWWCEGVNILHAFPTLSSGDRSLLEYGVCPKCIAEMPEYN